jgi:hypothetical protein
LAFENLIKKVEKIYEVDLAYHISDRVRIVRKDIETYNETILIATNDGEEKSKKWPFREKETFQFKENFIIDIESITPDDKAVEDHREKLKEIFGEF